MKICVLESKCQWQEWSSDDNHEDYHDDDDNDDNDDNDDDDDDNGDNDEGDLQGDTVKVVGEGGDQRCTVSSGKSPVRNTDDEHVHHDHHDYDDHYHGDDIDHDNDNKIFYLVIVLLYLQ